jgi:hypothetical protein
LCDEEILCSWHVTDDHDLFFEMGSIAPASASIDAYNYFITIFKVSAVYKSWITQSVHKYQPAK